MKTRIARIIEGTRYEIIARKLYSWAVPNNKPNLYELEITEILKRKLKTNSNCIDVGCHKGSVLKQILRYAPYGRHFAFEPIPELYSQLHNSFKQYPNVTIFELALSNNIGERCFKHVISNPGYSGFKERTYKNNSEEIVEIIVDTNYLDNIIPDDIPIDLIKVDVEGAELEVLKGATHIIKINRPIILFEHGIGGCDHYGTTPTDIYDLLVIECGLNISLMHSLLKTNKPRPFTQDEFSQQVWNHVNFYFAAYK